MLACLFLCDYFFDKASGCSLQDVIINDLVFIVSTTCRESGVVLQDKSVNWVRLSQSAQHTAPRGDPFCSVWNWASSQCGENLNTSKIGMPESITSFYQPHIIKHVEQPDKERLICFMDHLMAVVENSAIV